MLDRSATLVIFHPPTSHLSLPSRGRILGQNPDKALRVSSLLNTVTTTALPWDSYFFILTQPLTVSTVQLLYTVKEKGGKPDRKQYPLTLWFKKSIQKPQVWEHSRLWPETSTKLYVHEFGFSFPIWLGSQLSSNRAFIIENVIFLYVFRSAWKISAC